MRNRTNDSLRVFWEVKQTCSRSYPSSFQQDSCRPSGVEVSATSTCLPPVCPYLPWRAEGVSETQNDDVALHEAEMGTGCRKNEKGSGPGLNGLGTSDCPCPGP